jgi:hypothetical protein
MAAYSSLVGSLVVTERAFQWAGHRAGTPPSRPSRARLPDGVGDRILIRDVHLDEQTTDLRRNRPPALLVEVGDGHGCAGLGQGPSRGRSEARGASGDERGAPDEVHNRSASDDRDPGGAGCAIELRVADLGRTGYLALPRCCWTSS